MYTVQCKHKTSDPPRLRTGESYFEKFILRGGLCLVVERINDDDDDNDIQV